MCICCYNWYAGGDMSPRLMLCSLCGKRNAFIGESFLIDKFSKERAITYEDAWDIAYKFLKQKQEEYKAKGDIYFDEDYFQSDLIEYYENLRFSNTLPSQYKPGLDKVNLKLGTKFPLSKY